MISACSPSWLAGFIMKPDLEGQRYEDLLAEAGVNNTPVAACENKEDKGNGAGKIKTNMQGENAVSASEGSFTEEYVKKVRAVCD